jgi:hypothetical protein
VTVHIFATAGRTLYLVGVPMPLDLATCTVDGRTFSAQSYSGAVCELCRTLAMAGVPDQPFEVITSARRRSPPAARPRAARRVSGTGQRKKRDALRRRGLPHNRFSGVKCLRDA